MKGTQGFLQNASEYRKSRRPIARIDVNNNPSQYSLRKHDEEEIIEEGNRRLQGGEVAEWLKIKSQSKAEKVRTNLREIRANKTT